MPRAVHFAASEAPYIALAAALAPEHTALETLMLAALRDITWAGMDADFLYRLATAGPAPAGYEGEVELLYHWDGTVFNLCAALRGAAYVLEDARSILRAPNGRS